MGVSIHALRVEGDEKLSAKLGLDITFQSTPSAWRATRMQ